MIHILNTTTHYNRPSLLCCVKYPYSDHNKKLGTSWLVFYSEKAKFAAQTKTQDFNNRRFANKFGLAKLNQIRALEQMPPFDSI